MTSIVFQTAGSRITGFELQGHSGYGEEGTDIVCAAITSAVRLVECTVNDVLGLAAPVRLNPPEYTDADPDMNSGSGSSAAASAGHGDGSQADLSDCPDDAPGADTRACEPVSSGSAPTSEHEPDSDSDSDSEFESDSGPWLSFRLPGGLEAHTETACQSLLTGLMVYFSRLQEEYPENIQVLEAL